MNIKVLKTVGFISMVATGVLSLVVGYVDEKKMENEVEEKVKEAMNKYTGNTENNITYLEKRS